MDKMPIFQPRTPGEACRNGLSKDKMTVGSGADQIDLYYFGPGHTNGDTWVSFTAHRNGAHEAICLPTRGCPSLDADNGGSVLHYPESLNKGFNGIKNVDTIINGHKPAHDDPVGGPEKQFADFNQDFLTWAQAPAQSRQDAGTRRPRSGSCRRGHRLLRDGQRDVRRPARPAPASGRRDEAIGPMRRSPMSVRITSRPARFHDKRTAGPYWQVRHGDAIEDFEVGSHRGGRGRARDVAAAAAVAI